MARGERQSTAGPSGTQRRAENEVPPYQPPSFPLNPAAQRALAQLTQTHNLKKLDESLGEAQGALSNAAGDINERLTEKENYVKRQKGRNLEQGTQDAEIEDDIEQSRDELRDKVERMTQRMDETMRKIIDGQHSVQSIKDSVAAMATEARANASTQASTQQLPSQRRRRPPGAEDGDDADEDYEDFEPTNPAAGTQNQPTPIETFRSKIEDAKTRYQSYSLTTRYADNNDYRDFRRVVHDAKYPNGEVALPHHSEWFEEGQAPAPGVTTRSRNNGDDEDDDDDDIAISRATISTKCPLTLQEFKTPLTSHKCPHSFEAEAILSMIKSSRQRAVQCPVPGCSQILSNADLHTDAVLIRQIKRLQRAKELEQEEAEEDDRDVNGRGTQDGATMIDDEDEDGADVDDIVEGRSTQVKRERLTGRSQPAPMSPGGTAGTVDLDGSDDDEDTMEE